MAAFDFWESRRDHVGLYVKKQDLKHLPLLAQKLLMRNLFADVLVTLSNIQHSIFNY